MSEERQVIADFIELYRDLPCLWDLSCEEYKDQDQKSVAWEILVAKLKTIDPNANVASAKQKIENLKSSYKREVKKVKDSKKRTDSGAHEVHKPTLWYYDLMQFLDKKDVHLRRGRCTLSSDDESQGTPVVKKRGYSLLERNKQKLIEKAQDKESKKKTNTFGLYVGEQLESLSSQQRLIAEKLISDVIFLGKTENLNFHSRVESNNTQCCFTDPLEYITSSPHYETPSPQYNTPSPQYIVPSPQPQHTSYAIPQYVSLPSVSTQINALPPSSPHIQTQPTIQSIQYSSPSQHQTQPTETPAIVQISIPSPPLPQTVQTDNEENSQSIMEGPSGTLLKKLLVFKNKE